MRTMTAKNSRSSKRRTRFALLLAAGITMLVCGHEAFAQLPPLPPLPPPPPIPLPLPLPLPPPDLPLGPPELPIIPSLPQIFPPDAPTTSGSTELPVTGATLDAKILIISADGTEPVLGAIRQAAEYAGIPYTLYIGSQTPGGFTPAMLSDGNAHAFYQGIVLTTGTLGYFNGTAWTSAFSMSEWQTLWDYQAKYRVRTAIGYLFPTADYGYGPATGVDASTNPISAQLTAAGQSVFPYVNSANPMVITKAWTYLAAAAGTGTNVLLADSQGHALALVRTYPDGRQVFSMTFDGNFFLVHSLALSHGLMNWVTGGLFLGERRVYVAPQIDDIFLDNDMYGGGVYRINAVDWAATAAWQTQKQLYSQTADLRIHMAFNGEGTAGKYAFDTLTPAVDVTDFQFPWINHTYTHENLDAVSYDVAYREITRNNQTAASMGFANYDPRALVTPDISGLSNPEAMRAAYDAGIRFVVTDTSRPGMNNPTPQAGIPNWHEPRILMIPRRPVNLFYNVSTPSEWTTEYNQIYRSFWGRDLSYTELLDKESEVLLQYLLRGEIDPWMFHQANLRAYDGVHTLLGDLLDRTLQKYGRLYVLPVRSLPMADLGEWTENRMRYNDAGVRCSFNPDQGRITITATRAAVVPVTGLCNESSEVYGGQCITQVSLSAGQTVTYNFEGEDITSEASAGTFESAPARVATPNPMVGSGLLRFATTRSGPITGDLFDVRGRRVKELYRADAAPAGYHDVVIDGRGSSGERLSPGVYFYRITTADGPITGKIALMK